MITGFQGFPKMGRLMRDVVVTEKIDGTNAQIFIMPTLEAVVEGIYDPVTTVDDLGLWAGSRTQWITPAKDNHGFAKWVVANASVLAKGLGPGRHFGEWWGGGIQRGYGFKKGEKAFSLFNVEKWTDEVRPVCCSVVPTLYKGIFSLVMIDKVLEDLQRGGSVAAPGFMDPEGIVVYHTAAGVGFKRTIKNDDQHKEQFNDK